MKKVKTISVSQQDSCAEAQAADLPPAAILASASAPVAEAMSVRRRGRPTTNEGPTLNRNSILRAALRLAKTLPLQDLSIVTVARSMNVTPALIHYYIGGRDWLTSGVINLFYRDLLKRWPAETGNWQDDVHAVAKLIFDRFAMHAGVAAYVVSNNRFRIFQLTAFGDRDYGVEMLEQFTARVRAAGLSSERTGIYAHLLLEFIISTSYGASRHIFPSEHQKFLEEKTAQLDPGKYPNLIFVHRAPFQIDGKTAFEEVCRLFLLGMTNELAAMTSPPASAPEARPRLPIFSPPENLSEDEEEDEVTAAS